jgi:hypothetical protein
MAHVFDPDQLRAIARNAVGLPHEQMLTVVIEGLRTAYPGHIAARPRWVLNRAGGAMGVMMLLHGSLSEYVMLFGTPIGTEGFSGRYRLDIHDFVLAGEMWTFAEDDVAERGVLKAGDVAHLAPGRGKGYRIPESAWMLEYGRGPVLTMLPFGLSESLVSLDFITIARTLRAYAPLALRELVHGKV